MSTLDGQVSDSVWQRPTTPPTVLHPGRLLGRYQIETRLPGGAMGEVWKAFDPVRKRHVVIKLLPLLLQGNAIEIKRIEESFYKVERLNHENICPVYDLGRDEDVGYYLVMNFVDGVTLAVHRHVLEKNGQPLMPSNVVQLLKPIAVALDFLHQHGIVHRDIKPQNIMIQADDHKPLLVDFGLAEEIRSSVSRMSRMSFDVSGTYPYMSPEQWKAQPQDGRTDQYALAVVLYEMLGGRLPFESSDPQILRLCVLGDAPPNIESISGEANQVLAKGLAKQARDRFSSCVALIDAFQLACQKPRSSAIDFPTVSRVASVATSRFFGVDDTARRGSLPKSRDAIITGALVVTVLGFGWLNRGMWTSSQPTQNTASTGAAPNANPTPSNPTTVTPSASTGGSATGAAPVNAPVSATNQSVALATNAKPQSVVPATPQPASSSSTQASRSVPTPTIDPRLIKQTEEAQALANRAHYDAENNNAREYALGEWEKAEQFLTQANMDYANAKLTDALTGYQSASRTYYEAINLARRSRTIAENMQSELNQLSSARKAALDSQAERLAKPEYEAAVVAEAAMKKFIEAHDYLQIAKKLDEAKAGYRAAQQIAEQALKVESSKTVFDGLVRSMDPELLKRYGGQAWQDKLDRIQAAKNSSEQLAGYQAAIDMLPDIQKQVRSREIDGMIGRREHAQVLSMLWPDFPQIDPALRKAFNHAAANAPRWWIEQGINEVAAGDFDNHSKAMMLVALAKPASCVGVEVSKYADEAVKLAEKIESPQESMETKLEIAQEILHSRDPKLLDELVTEIKVGLYSLDSNARHPQDKINKWLKTYVPVRCAALLWQSGDKEQADAFSGDAYASHDSGTLYHKDVAVYNGLLVYGEAHQLKNLNGVANLRTGSLGFSEPKGQRDYTSLLSIRIPVPKPENSGSEARTKLDLMAHAFVAAAAAEMRDRGLFQVHYRRVCEGIKEVQAYDADERLVISTIQARIAIAEAYNHEFVASAGRIRNFVKDPLPLGEAMLELGRSQLACVDDVKATGIEGAKSTLTSFGDHPRAAILAREIAAAMAKKDIEAAIAWCKSLPEGKQRIGAMSGIALAQMSQR